MAKSIFNNGLLTLFCVIFSGNSALSQEMIYEIPMSKQVELSSQIIEGEVVSKKSFWDGKHDNIYTSHTVKVYKVFKGHAFETIEVITRGGIIDLEAEVVSHSLQLRHGDMGVFMLTNNNYINTTGNISVPIYKPVSATQSFYKYSLEKDMAVNTFKSVKGIANEFYNQISQNTGTNIVEIEFLNIQEKVSQNQIALNRSSTTSNTASITTFSASNYSAGTKSVLTIYGSGYGSTQGTIGFSNANYGGALHTNALDNQVLYWSDTEIQVEIPHFAGTGTVMINTTSNGSIESSDTLFIEFAEINFWFDMGSGQVAYQTQHIDNNSNGGYTWEMNDAFAQSSTRDAFERAFNSWTCGTGINWEIASATTSVNTSSNDDINIITFDTANPFPSGLLAQTYSRYSGCAVGTEIQWFVEEIDMVFNGSKNWNYTTNPPISGEVDFETAAVHELGHGHQLGHVIDTNVVMHYSLSSGESQRTLSNSDLTGASDVQARSTTTSVCSQIVMTESACFASLGTDDYKLSDGLKIFPNPAKEEVFIKNNVSLNINRINFYNLEGRLVYSFAENNYNNLRRIDISSLSQGMYFIKIDTDYELLTYKLMIK
jgi:hypothetical protein